MLRIDQSEDALSIEVIAKTRASKTGVKGVQDGKLVLAVAAPPVDGVANEQIRRALAELAGVRLRDVTIVSGATARYKRLRIAGADASRLLEAITSTLGPDDGTA